MKKPFRLLLLLTIFVLYAFKGVFSQDIPVKPTIVKTGRFVGVSPPLRDLPAMSKEELTQIEKKAKRMKNEEWERPTYPFASIAQPKGPDPVWQNSMGQSSTNSKAPMQFFEGQSSPYYPPDCNGAAGPNHYMQTVNCTYAIYSKTGTLLAGPTNMNLLFGSVTGANYNDGDPLIMYDEQANRWVAVEFSISGTNDYMLFAVSTTSDPTGTWYQYSFDVVDMPDYEKIGIWPDGYYMATNTQPTTGNDIYVFERSKMLQGLTAQMVAFDNPYRPGTGVVEVPPVDNDGPAAPAGAPGTFIAFNDDGVGGGSDQLWLYELAVNWTTPASSTFNRTQQLNVAAFDTQFNNWEDIDQPGTTRNLCAISTVIMNAPQYRNFGTYQSIVCCHTVDVDGTNHAGVRWYELRKTPPSTTWVIRQQGTYAPDAHSRWMGAISMNSSSKIALGYSLSSATEYPGIRYTGQSSAAYASASGVMDVPEEIALTGTNYQSTYNRWGDYASMSVDPSDDQTFWFTTEYIGASEARKTKILSFKIGNSPIVTTTAATSIASASATLNGTVNPNSIATTYHFEWGLTTSYGNSSTTTSAGSGSSAIAVNAAISGLVLNQTYHFRIVAENTDGTSYGSDLTFVAGGASVTTTAASAIGLTTATAGGNVTADGGSAVTARGVCWSTTANPTIADSHTTDGSGLGTFTSSITGLASSTLYHIRAYATTANGTYYGSDLQFTTLCGVYLPPFSEGFTNTTIPGCWTQVDNQGNGQVWQFGTITGQSPNPTLTGNYAFLNSDAYGSGNSQNADLISPVLDLTGYTGVTLAFSYYFKSYTGSSGTLSYSINNGTTWTVITSFTTTSTTNPTSFSQVIAAVAGQSQVKFKWNYTGTWGYYWAIDNISVTGTASLATVTTTTPTAITTTTATSGGNVTNIGGSAVTAKGVCWSTTADPVVTGNHTTDGSGVGSFTSSITGLSAGTVYHVRAYATNTSGTAYGSDIQFTTAANLPTVTTTTPTSITYNTASSGGNVTADGGATVTARGVCWATTASPTIANSYTTDGSGTGSFTSAITGLNAGTLYHVRAYATNSAGTSYGSDLQFTTPVAPTLSVTPAMQSVTSYAGSTSFTVTSNSSWSVVSDQAWCTVTPSGTGNGTITANYTQNVSVAGRVANVTVTVTGLTPVVVTVSQAGAAPILSVTPPDQAVTSSAGNTSFTVTSNASWTASSNQSWCTVTASGSGNGSIAAAYAENTTFSTRIATITVTVSGLSPVQVTVTQAAAIPTLGVSPSSQNVTSAAGSTSFTVTSNTSWSAVSDQAWCTPTASGSGNGSITANYLANSTYSTRTATITVSASGVTPVNVTVIQAGSTPPEFLYTIANDVQTSEKTFEFDLLLLDNDPTLPFELATVQAGIFMNSAVYNGGTVTASIVAGTSTLNASQQPASISYTQSANIIKLAAKAPPGAGNGTILSTNPASPTRICRIKMTNTVAWAQAQPNLAFCFTTTPYPTKISQYISGVNTAMTTNTTNCYSVCANGLLNPPPVLSVLPPDQTVTSAAGSVPFTVSSNAAWTVSSDQAWCTVTPSGYANGVITATYTANNSSVTRVANITVTVTGLSPVVVTVTQNGVAYKTLNLTAFLEGLYDANGLMHPAMDESGPHWGAGIADKITIELHNAANYGVLVYSASNVDLSIAGLASVTIPAAYTGSYYITIRHRNSIETVSALPVSFAGSTISYSFDSSSMAYGGNVMSKGDGHYVIYGGDANQDGLVDSGDMIMIDNDASAFVTGYTVTDLNGDGLVDSGDMILLDNNASNFIAVSTP